MHDSRLIATATATLRQLLARGIGEHDAALAQVDVTTVPPDKVNAHVDRPTLNIYLCHAVINQASRAAALPTPGGELAHTPLTLDLHYLLTSYGRVDVDKGDLTHRVLGATISVLHDHPVVTAAQIDASMPLPRGLPRAQQVRITPLATSLTEMSSLWSMFHSQYRLSVMYVVTVALTASELTESEMPPAEQRTDLPISRRLEEFAPRIDPRATWEDLAINASQRKALQVVISDYKTSKRSESKSPPSTGAESEAAAESETPLTVVFSGGADRERLLAAQVIARELELDIYRVNLTALVSEYIGETEKNLARMFDIATSRGAVLLFDEADALFGLRDKVANSTDGYANIEVSYLLERLAQHDGVVILSTAQRGSIDAAFLRRTRYTVEFAK